MDLARFWRAMPVRGARGFAFGSHRGLGKRVPMMVYSWGIWGDLGTLKVRTVSGLYGRRQITEPENGEVSWGPVSVERCERREADLRDQDKPQSWGFGKQRVAYVFFNPSSTSRSVM